MNACTAACGYCGRCTDDDPGPPWVCEHCGSFRHKPTCWRVTRLEKATRKPQRELTLEEIAVEVERRR